MSPTPDPAKPTRPDPTDTALVADRSRLDDLLARWAAGRRSGIEPNPEDLCPYDPWLREALRHRIEAERLLEAQPISAVATVTFVGAARDGPAADPPTRDGLPPVPGYTLVRELGCGGMGVVYEAVQAGLNRPAALKMMLPDRPVGGTEAVRFLAEAEAVAAVRHPHVVQVYEFGQYAGRPFIAMELCPRSLKNLLASEALTPRDAARLVAKVAQGVQAAHTQQIVHRDLKPGNVLLDADGEPKVTDFGLAKRGPGSDLTRTNAVLGTPDYMAPEQGDGRAKFVGPAADVWALGVILYECLTRQRPFVATDTGPVARQVRDAAPTRLRSVDRNVPKDLETICLKCLEKDPANRYTTAAALASDLDNYLEGRPITARPRSAVDRAWRYCAARPLETCLTLLFALLFVRFVVGNAEIIFGVGLPANLNLDLRTVLNVTFLGGTFGATVGFGVVVAAWVRGRRPVVLATVARGAIAGLVVMAAAALALPPLERIVAGMSSGGRDTGTFSGIGTRRLPGVP